MFGISLLMWVKTIVNLPPNYHKQVGFKPFPVMGGKHGIVFPTLVIINNN